MFFFIWGDCKFSLVKVWTMHIELKCGKTVRFSKTMHYLPKKCQLQHFANFFYTAQKYEKENSNFKKTKIRKKINIFWKKIFITFGVCSLVRNLPLEIFFKKGQFFSILPWVLVHCEVRRRTHIVPKKFLQYSSI